jgi:hypothetical protein
MAGFAYVNPHAYIAANAAAIPDHCAGMQHMQASPAIVLNTIVAAGIQFCCIGHSDANRNVVADDVRRNVSTVAAIQIQVSTQHSDTA